MRFLKRLMLLAILGACAAGAGFYFLTRPFAGFRGEAFVEIPRGASTPAIARMLAGAGAIESEWPFLLARAVRPGSKLQAGEYRFSSMVLTIVRSHPFRNRKNPDF